MGLFNNFDKVGPGVSKDAPEKHRFFLFFELFSRKFTKLIILNILYLITLIPLILGIKLSMQVNPNITANPSLMFSQPLFSFTGDIIGMVIMIIAAVITGPATAGFTYVIRNFQREEHAWVTSDFFEQFKKNFKQGMAMSIIDVFVYTMLYIAFSFYAFSLGGSMGAFTKMSPFLTAITVLMFVIFTWMHYYIYVMMVTFDLKLKDIFKNSVLFAFGKLPLNLLISVILFVLSFFAVYYMGIGIIVMAIIGLSLMGYIITFCVYPTIDKLMIKPNTPENKNEEQSDFNDNLIL